MGLWYMLFKYVAAIESELPHKQPWHFRRAFTGLNRACRRVSMAAAAAAGLFAPCRSRMRTFCTVAIM